MRLPRECAAPGCTRLVVGRAFCDEHEAVASELDRARNRMRLATRRARGIDYDHRYRRLRDELMQNARCARCGKPANELHHIVPLTRGGTHDRANLVPLCDACHEQVHRELRRRV